MKLALVSLLVLACVSFAEAQKGGANKNGLEVPYYELFSAFLNNTSLMDKWENAMEECADGGRKGKGNGKKKAAKKGKTSKKSKKPLKCPSFEAIMGSQDFLVCFMDTMDWAYGSIDTDTIDRIMSDFMAEPFGVWLDLEFRDCVDNINNATIDSIVGQKCAGKYNATEAGLMVNRTDLISYFECASEAMFDSPALADYAKHDILGIPPI